MSIGTIWDFFKRRFSRRSIETLTDDIKTPHLSKCEIGTGTEIELQVVEIQAKPSTFSKHEAEVETEIDRYTEGEQLPQVLPNCETGTETEFVEPIQIHTQTSFLPLGEISFKKYLRYMEIQAYLHQLEAAYPELVKVQDYGLSYENRHLTLIHISKRDSNDYNKPIIFIDAGIHAREWIAPAQALYIINQLVENSENQYLIEKVDWIVVPLLNPDGYEYCHLVDRFWRKTRSKGKSTYGVDPNRNFSYKWRGPGGNTNECSNSYAGPEPFSEPETAALSKVIEEYSDRVQLYLTFHSAATCLVYPWGSPDGWVRNSVQLHTLAMKVAKAIRAVNGTNYRVGDCYGTLGATSGCSRDWVYAAQGIKLAYTVALPSYGDTRYEMPPEKILGTVTETFEGIKVFHKHVESRYVLSKDLREL